METVLFVRFLQKKLNSFKKNDSQQVRLKKKAPRVPSHVGINDASAFYGASTEVPSTSKRTDLDLNQDAAMVCNFFLECYGYLTKRNLFLTTNIVVFCNYRMMSFLISRGTITIWNLKRLNRLE
mgnify:CR=1 FL=1